MISASMFKEYMNQSRRICIHLADGRKIHVPHGEHLSLQPGGRIFSLWRTDGALEVFNLTMVISMAVTEKARSKQRNKS
jgi:hypothetical protein